MDEPEEEGQPVCICCLKEIPHDRVLFCPECGAPVDPIAAYLPFEQILAYGYVFREACWRPRSSFTVRAMIGWMSVESLWLVLTLLTLFSVVPGIPYPYGGEMEWLETSNPGTLETVTVVEFQFVPESILTLFAPFMLLQCLRSRLEHRMSEAGKL